VFARVYWQMYRNHSSGWSVSWPRSNGASFYYTAQGWSVSWPTFERSIFLLHSSGMIGILAKVRTEHLSTTQLRDDRYLGQSSNGASFYYTAQRWSVSWRKFERSIFLLHSSGMIGILATFERSIFLLHSSGMISILAKVRTEHLSTTQLRTIGILANVRTEHLSTTQLRTIGILANVRTEHLSTTQLRDDRYLGQRSNGASFYYTAQGWSVSWPTFARSIFLLHATSIITWTNCSLTLNEDLKLAARWILWAGPIRLILITVLITFCEFRSDYKFM